jgi:LysR family transcriptional activator of nhaA
MTLLNYHHLRYFQAIATSGNLTRAAERLNVSPSSLSVQLKALEEQLGQLLFERRGRSLHLTEAGKIALDYANTVFRSGDELLNTLKGLGLASRKVLRIGAVATLSRNFQLGMMRPLIGRDDVELIVRSGGLDDLLVQLEAHSLDLVLANQPASIDTQSQWQNTLVAEQPVSIVGRPYEGHERFRFPHDLADKPIIVPGRSSTIRMQFDRLTDEAGVRPYISAEVDDMAMLRLFARESTGVTLVPSVVVIDELTSGLLVELCRLPMIREAFYAITARRQFANPLIGELTGTADRHGPDLFKI